MSKGKTILNKYTGDLDGFNDGEYEKDLNSINENNTTLENRVTTNETNILNNANSIGGLDTRVTTLEGETGMTTSVTVKDGGGVDITLNFTNGKLTSIT